MAERERKNFNKGFVFKAGDAAYAALQIWVKNTQMRQTPQGKNVFEVDGYGYFAGPSNIEYVLGKGLLNQETGSVSVRGAAWDRRAEWTEKMNLRQGDLIRVYGPIKDRTWTGKDGTQRHTLEITLDKVEIDYRKKGDTAAKPQPETTATPALDSSSLNLDEIAADDSVLPF